MNVIFKNFFECITKILFLLKFGWKNVPLIYIIKFFSTVINYNKILQFYEIHFFFIDIIEATSKLGSEVTVERDDGVSFDNLFVEEDFCSRLKDEKNNNVDHEISEQPILEVPLLNEGPCLESNVSFSEEVNFSRESDLPKFPQVM